jgi:heat-inducible transcriptional repressor
VELTQRQRAILKAVIEEYVLTAVPVPSEKLSGRPGLKVSSATVRSELGELEALGLLTHPHTSAGRVPSDLGYRFYIEHLMQDWALGPMEQQTIWHQFHQVESEVDEWGPLAAAVLAQAAQTAALVTKLHSRQNRLKRVELISVQEDLALVVLVLRSGGIEQRMLRLEKPLGRQELINVANKLSAALEDLTASQVIRKASKLVGLEQEVAVLVARLMEQSERFWDNSIFYEGIGYVFRQPEFGRAERMIDLMEMLNRGSRLAPLLSEALECSSIRVIVGSEHRAEHLRDFSVVLKRYGPSDEAAGVLGVLGPTRMQYWRVVALVRFMADLLDRLAEQSMR